MVPATNPKWVCYTARHLQTYHEEVIVSADRSQMTAEQLATEKKRLWWHSRRGMLELDVLLLPFLEEVYDTLNEEDKERYRNLLDCEDPDLFKWFMKNGRSDNPEHQHMVDMIVNRVQPS